MILNVVTYRGNFDYQYIIFFQEGVNEFIIKIIRFCEKLIQLFDIHCTVFIRTFEKNLGKINGTSRYQRTAD